MSFINVVGTIVFFAVVALAVLAILNVFFPFTAKRKAARAADMVARDPDVAERDAEVAAQMSKRVQ